MAMLLACITELRCCGWDPSGDMAIMGLRCCNWDPSGDEADPAHAGLR